MLKKSFSVVLDLQKLSVRDGGGGVKQPRVRTQKGGRVSSVRMRTRGRGGQILANLERTY